MSFICAAAIFVERKYLSDKINMFSFSRHFQLNIVDQYQWDMGANYYITIGFGPGEYTYRV
jgi:hypothetical protein